MPSSNMTFGPAKMTASGFSSLSSLVIRFDRNSVSPCFWLRRLRSTVPRLSEARALPRAGKSIWAAFLFAVNDALLLHVEGDGGELADSRVAGNAAEDGDQGIRVERLEGGGARILRGEVDDHLHVEGWILLLALDGGFLFEGLLVGRLDFSGLDIERHLFIFGGQSGFDIPIKGAEAVGAVAHQPIDMVLPFPDFEGALQIGRTAGIVVNGGHGDVLGEVDRVFGVVVGGDPEDHGEVVVGTGEFLEGNGDLIAGMELEVEADYRLVDLHNTG